MEYLLTLAIVAGIGFYVWHNMMQNKKKMDKVVERYMQEEEEKALGIEKTDWAEFTGGYEKLEKYFTTPHVVDEAFYKIYEKPPTFSNKEVWAEKAATYPVVYGAVLQAHECLFDPDDPFAEDDGSLKGLVLVATKDPARSHDAAWLQNIAKQLSFACDSADVPEILHEILRELRDEQSMFCKLVPTAMTDGVEVYCFTDSLYPDDLPGKRIPIHRILPVLVTEPEVDIGGLRLIKAENYL